MLLLWLQYLIRCHRDTAIAIIRAIRCHRDTAIAIIRAHFLSNFKNNPVTDSYGFITSERSALIFIQGRGWLPRSSHLVSLSCILSYCHPVFIFHHSLLGVSQATSSATFLQSSSSTSPYLVSIKPPQLPSFFRLHLPSLPTWCISSHLSFICIFHLSLLGVSQATSSAAFLQSAYSTSPYLVSLKPPQVRPFSSQHLPPLPTWCLSSHLKPGLSFVCIFHLFLLGVSQATSSATFLQSASSTSPYLVSPPLPTWCLSSHLKCGLSFVCIFHLSLLGVSQATSSAAFLSSASSTSLYLVSLKPPQARPFFRLHLPPLPTWCLSSHLKRGLSFVASSISPYLVSLKPPQSRPFFSLHLPPLPTWCLSSHLKCRLSLVCIFHLSLLGVSQASSTAAFLQSASSISPYLVSLKPPQARPFFSLHLPPLPTWCLSSHLKPGLSLVCIFHLSLLGVSQATSSAAFLQSASSTSPYLVSLKPPQARPFFRLHLPPLPTWCLSSHLKRRLSLVFIFHISLLGVSQATSSAAFLQSASSISPYLVSLKPHQCHLSLVCIFHLSLLGVSQATSMPPFFSLHLPPLPTWCLSSHLNATFLQSASSTSPYLVSLKPPQLPPFFRLHLPSLPTWCLSSLLNCRLSFVCIFHLSLLGVSQATSSPAFLQSASSTSPYLVSLKPSQARPFFRLHLPPLPTWCLSSHFKRRLSLVFIFHLCLLGVSQATSMPPFFSLHIPPLPTWCLSSLLNCRLSFVCTFHLSLLGVSQATSSATFLQSASSTSPYLVSPPLPTWCLSSHLKCGLSFVCIFHLSLLGVSQATSSAAFLSSASSTSLYLVSLKPPQARPFFLLHLPPLPTWCLSSHLKCRLSLVCIFHLSLLGVSQATSIAAFLQSASSISAYLVSLKPPQVPPFFSLHLPHLPTWCLSSHLKCRLSLVCIFHLSLLGVYQATSMPPFFSLHLPSLPTWCLSSHLRLSLVC